LAELTDFSDLAKHNEQISTKINVECNAWSAIILFYSALHRINFYCTKNYPYINCPNNHRERMDFIERYLPNRIYKAYRHLYHYSELYRYHPPMWKNISVKDKDVINSSYQEIKSFVCN
jgi:hypothetical protein